MNKLITLFAFLLIVWSCNNTPPKNAESTSEEITSTEEVTPEEPVHTPKFDYDTTKWLDIADLDPTIVIDMRYATANNFVKEKMYECGRCFLRPEAARKIVTAHEKLQTQGLGLKMFDCYRPKPIQQKLWDKVPNPNYVTPPAKGSQHNRGLAVDLTIVDENGEELAMGTEYDYFGKEGHHTYKDFEDETILDNRTLLLETMKAFGFKHIRTEWWHYSYIHSVKDRRISEMLWNCEE